MIFNESNASFEWAFFIWSFFVFLFFVIVKSYHLNLARIFGPFDNSILIANLVMHVCHFLWPKFDIPVRVHIPVKTILTSTDAADSCIAWKSTSLKPLEFRLVLLSLFNELLNLVYVQKIEKFQHTDLPVFDFSQHWKGEYSNESDHADRYETYKVDEKIIVLWSFHGILK